MRRTDPAESVAADVEQAHKRRRIGFRLHRLGLLEKVLGVVAAVLTLASVLLGLRTTSVTNDRDHLKVTVESLQRQRADLVQQVDVLTQEAGMLRQERDDLQAQLDALPSDPVAGSTTDLVSGTGSFQYLAEMEAVNGYASTGSVNLNGTAYAEGVFWELYPCDEVSADYDLSRDWSTFTAKIGLGDLSRDAAAAMEFRFFADNELLLKETIRLGEGKDVEVPVDSALRLRLEVSYLAAESGCNGDAAYAVWADPRVVR